MAFPSPIKVIGELSMYSDVFEYFKGALYNTYSPNYSLGNLERWPVWFRNIQADISFIQSGTFETGGITFPMTRQRFYDWIDYWVRDDTYDDATDEGYMYCFKLINGQPLYTFAEPSTDWPVRALNDWGKIKSLELAIFGNVANGGSLSSNSIFTSGHVHSRVPEFSICSLTYLRCALVRFADYGCHPFISIRPEPTSPVTNTGARTFNWTNAPGFNNNSDYEYSINEGSWTVVSSKPISIPSNVHVPAGKLLVRTRSAGISYINPSEPIYNSAAYIGPVYVHVWVGAIDASTFRVHIRTADDSTFNTNIMVTGQAQFNFVGGGTFTQPYSVVLGPGDYQYMEIIGFTNGPVDTVTPGVINTATPSPTSIDGRTIIVVMNDSLE